VSSRSSTSKTPPPEPTPAEKPTPAPEEEQLAATPEEARTQEQQDTEAAQKAVAEAKGKPGERTQVGGTVLVDGQPVGYTREGALSATKGGPVDPTVMPPELAPEGSEPKSPPDVITRADAP